VSSQGELAILLTRPGDLDVFSTGTLARVSLSGGEPRHVLDDVSLADWSPDGRELAVLRRVDGVFQLEYPIGNPIVRPLPQTFFRVSPKGDKVAVHDDGLKVYDRRGNKIATLTVPFLQGTGLAWDGDDALWVLAGQGARSLWRVTLDGKAREVYRALGTIGSLHDASPDGRLLVHHGFERLGVKAKAPGEADERELSVFGSSMVAALSEDGRRILFAESGGGPPGVTYLQSTRGSPPVRLSEGCPLALSPDGKRALLGCWPKRLPLTLVQTGAGEPRELPTNGLESAENAWFLDNERVVVNAKRPGGQPTAFLFDLAGGAPRPITPEGSSAVPGSHAAGTVIGWTSGTGTLARIALAGGEPRPLEGRVLFPDYPIRAAGDGRSLFVSAGGVPRQVERLDLGSGKRTPWKSLLPEEPAGVVMILDVFLTGDGQGYAYTYGRFLQDLFVIEGLRGSGLFAARPSPDVQ
jgi:hypothetical protein